MNDNDYIKGLLFAISHQQNGSAYKELFEFFYMPLRQFAYSLVKSNEEAEELVDDLFISIWEQKIDLKKIDFPKVYFYTAIKNKALNRLKALRRTEELPEDIWLVPADSFYFDPEKMMVTGEIIKQLKQAIQELPPRCRLIFKLVKEDGLRYKEVAEILGISLKTVETQIGIALKRLAYCMQFDINELHLKKLG